MEKNHNQSRMIPERALLALSGLLFLLAGILWVVEEISFGLIGVGVLGAGCYLIILVLKKRR